MSFWTRPMVAAKKAVAMPMTATTFSAIGECRKIDELRATIYTPAVTMVAAWISALTGVGPSIASGSQTYRGSCADLPMAPMKSRMQMAVSTPTCEALSDGMDETWLKMSPKLME